METNRRNYFQSNLHRKERERDSHRGTMKGHDKAVTDTAWEDLTKCKAKKNHSN